MKAPLTKFNETVVPVVLVCSICTVKGGIKLGHGPAKNRATLDLYGIFGVGDAHEGEGMLLVADNSPKRRRHAQYYHKRQHQIRANKEENRGHGQSEPHADCCLNARAHKNRQENSNSGQR